MKQIHIDVSGNIISAAELIKDAGMFQSGDKIPAELLVDMMLKGHMAIGMFALKDFLEEKARREWERKSISKKIIHKEISLTEAGEGPCVLFSKKNFDFDKPADRIKAVTSFPYLMGELLYDLLPKHEIFIHEENSAPVKDSKKTVEIHVVEHETLGEFQEGNYDLGLGTKHHGIDFGNKKIIRKVQPVHVLIALKGNEDFERATNSLESVLEARVSCELKVCIPEEKIFDAEKVLKAYKIQITDGSENYKWITVVIPLKKKDELWKKLKEAGAEQISEQPLKSLDKCTDGKT